METVRRRIHSFGDWSPVAMSSRALVRSIAWRLCLDLLSRGSFFFINILIARRIGAGEFGKLGYAISLAQIFYTFTDLGTLTQMLKELGEQRGKNEALWKTYLDLRLLFMAGCALVFAAIVPFVWKWDHGWVLLLALLWMFSNTMYDFNQFVCNGLDRMDLARRHVFIQRGFLIAGSIAGILLRPDVVGTLMGMGIGGGVGALIANVLSIRWMGASIAFRFNPNEWARIFRNAYPNAISGAFGSWYLRLGPLFLTWLWSATIVGEYAAAFRIFETSYIIPAGVMAVCVPFLSESLQKTVRMFHRHLFAVFALMTALGAAWAGMLYIGSPWIIRLFYGQEFLSAIPVLRLLAIVSAVVFLNYFVTYQMIIFNSQHRHAVHQAVVFALSGGFHYFFVRHQGSVGTAKALLLTEICLFLLTTGFLLQKRFRNAMPAAVPPVADPEQ